MSGSFSNTRRKPCSLRQRPASERARVGDRDEVAAVALALRSRKWRERATASRSSRRTSTRRRTACLLEVEPTRSSVEHRVRVGRVEHVQPQRRLARRRTSAGTPRARGSSRPCRAARRRCSPSAGPRRRTPRSSSTCSSIFSAIVEPAEAVGDLGRARPAPHSVLVAVPRCAAPRRSSRGLPDALGDRLLELVGRSGLDRRRAAGDDRLALALDARRAASSIGTTNCVDAVARAACR